jgi:hypothetical protein
MQQNEGVLFIQLEKRVFWPTCPLLLWGCTANSNDIIAQNNHIKQFVGHILSASGRDLPKLSGCMRDSKSSR